MGKLEAWETVGLRFISWNDTSGSKGAHARMEGYEA